MAVFVGFVDDSGIFAFDDEAAFRAHLARRFKGHEVVITVKKRPHQQGSQSLRYYRGVVVPDIAEASGTLDPDEFENIHQGLAWRFLRLPDGPMGDPRRRSTGKDEMSQEDITAYITKCIEWAESSIPGCVVRRPRMWTLSACTTRRGRESWPLSTRCC